MIIQGDCLTELKKLPDESVNCCLTSPPYWALRCYLPDEVKIKDNLPEKNKKEIEKELTLLGIKSIIRV
jgi:site-specific DNA-methyltransferase (cytosine-N4-specific)